MALAWEAPFLCWLFPLLPFFPVHGDGRSRDPHGDCFPAFSRAIVFDSLVEDSGRVGASLTLSCPSR